jgi:hypothetical protein
MSKASALIYMLQDATGTQEIMVGPEAHTRAPWPRQASQRRQVRR